MPIRQPRQKRFAGRAAIFSRSRGRHTQPEGLETRRRSRFSLTHATKIAFLALSLSVSLQAEALAQGAAAAPVPLGEADGFPFSAKAVSDDGEVVVGQRIGDPNGMPGVGFGAVRWTLASGAVTQVEDIFDDFAEFWETEGNQYGPK